MSEVDIPVIRPSYMGMSLAQLLLENQKASDEVLVVLEHLPYSQRSDGSYGPPMISLGRLREEFIIRMAFPHEAATFVR